MCGICGILAFSPVAASDLRAAIQGMAATLSHRGPDGDGTWLDEASGLALGHRRLAIIDLSPGGRQPMVSANGRYAIIYNGEIYNFRELRAELNAIGVRFRSRSDTEVLLEACAAWGVEATAKRLIGIFAFALWDKEERVLSLARDQLGVKPLYWSQANGVLLFGSELRALAAHPAWRPEIDRSALTAYFRHSYVPAPYTIYRHVFKLPPGSILVLRRDGVPLVSSYWDAWSVAKDGIAEPMAVDDGEAVARLDALLRDAIGRQMIADVPLGAFLSGGIDSSTVVALMQTQSASPVKTFTIGFREAGYNEAEHAAAVARHLRTDHTELYVAPEHARALIPSISDWFDEPFADSSQIPTFLVSQLARRHVKVALSGDGGDEVFAGYNRYILAAALWRRLHMLPAAVRGVFARTLRAVSPAAWDRLFAVLPSAWHPGQAGDKLHKLADVFTLDNEGAIYRRFVSQWERPESLVIGGVEPKGILWAESVTREIPNFIERMQFLDTVTYLPDDILAKVDRTSMAVSLETRVPLLDPGVVAFGWRLPFSMRMRDGKGKWLLRQVLYRYVPRLLVERPKMGFGVPVDSWLRGALRDWAEDLLDEERLRQDGLLDPGIVRLKWLEHLSGHRNWQHPLWCVLMFQEWKRRWIDGASLKPQSLKAVNG